EERRSEPLERALHRTIKKVTEDLNRMAYNTAIAAMMEFANAATAADVIHRDQLERFVLILSPFAPHLGEELWQRLRSPAAAHSGTPGASRWSGSLAYEPWPTYDEALTVEAEVEIPVQINGKLRSRILVPRDADEGVIERAALSDATIKAAIEG